MPHPPDTHVSPWGTLELGYQASEFYNYAGPNNVNSGALVNALTVKFGEGLLFGFTVNNTKASSQFILVFDMQSAPGAGAVPVCSFIVNASSNLPVNWIPPRTFRAGCFLANSSTSATLTAGSADCFFDVQFL